jgi:hypothetical protein
MKLIVSCKGEFLKIKVAKQVLNSIQIKNATAGTVTLNDIRKTL